MGVKRLGAYYAFWLPIAALVIPMNPWLIAVPLVVAEVVVLYWLFQRYGDEIIDIILRALNR